MHRYLVVNKTIVALLLLAACWLPLQALALEQRQAMLLHRYLAALDDIEL